jgi:expansin (peptidoglycan-binding protein)
MPQHVSLSDSVLTTVHISGRSASAVANGTAIDMQGWDAVRFVVSIGTFGVNSTFDGLVQTAPDSGFNTVTNVANSNLTQIPAANANAVAIVDVGRPTNRYIRFQATPAVNAIVYSVVADQYRRTGILPPPTQNAQQIVRVTQN